MSDQGVSIIDQLLIIHQTVLQSMSNTDRDALSTPHPHHHQREDWSGTRQRSHPLAAEISHDQMHDACLDNK